MPEIVNSVRRAFLILNLLRDNGRGMGVSEIARHLQLNGSTIHRLLQTLISCHVVQQDPATRNYYLGPQLLSYGAAVLDRFDFIQMARPFLTELSNEVQELTSIGILDNFELVYIDYVDASDRVMRMMPPIGRREYAHCTALGKVLLANLPPDFLAKFLGERKLPRRTENTITDPENLEGVLKTVLQKGYAYDQEETETGICCVAAPINNTSGKVVAAMSISGPATRMWKKGLETTLRDKVLSTANEVSKLTIT